MEGIASAISGNFLSRNVEKFVLKYLDVRPITAVESDFVLVARYPLLKPNLVVIRW